MSAENLSEADLATKIQNASVIELENLSKEIDATTLTPKQKKDLQRLVAKRKKDLLASDEIESMRLTDSAQRDLPAVKEPDLEKFRKAQAEKATPTPTSTPKPF